jgi:carbonic anhydrase
MCFTLARRILHPPRLRLGTRAISNLKDGLAKPSGCGCGPVHTCGTTALKPVQTRGFSRLGSDKMSSTYLGSDQDPAREAEELYHNNEMWRQREMERDPEIFKRLQRSQSPRYLWIGCADSRVPAEQICGLPPGSMFVHRNIANMVSNVDVSVMSVIQYAVASLKVQHIVICGHYNCGGIAAAMQNVDHQSPLENWLRNIKDVYRTHASELDAYSDENTRWNRLVELNVIEQAVNLYKTRLVQKRRTETFVKREKYGFVQPRIHPCVYDPGTGKLRKLDVEMQQVLSGLKHIYSLYSVEDSEYGQFGGMGSSITTPGELP